MPDYDIIGDIHGQADQLERLLGRLGYRRIQGVYQPDPSTLAERPRQAVFVGDFIDRGSANRRVIEIVRAMVEAGHALAVLGNHELNALAFHTPDPATGEPLRPHTEKNRAQHRGFLDEYPLGAAATREVLAWLQGLPLCLELPVETSAANSCSAAAEACAGAGGWGTRLRIVHACWDQASVDYLVARLGDPPRIDEGFLVEASRAGTQAFTAVETLLKGPEIALPPCCTFIDQDGHERRQVRYRWWATARTYREAALVPVEQRSAVPDWPLPAGLVRAPYAPTAPPVFVGHYWLRGAVRPQRPNVACLDYSVGAGGPLVAYRWRQADVLRGDGQIAAERFVTLGRVEGAGA